VVSSRLSLLREKSGKTSAAPLALGRQGNSNPALPGWADVWQAALRALTRLDPKAIDSQPQPTI